MKNFGITFDSSDGNEKTETIKVIGVGGGGSNAVNYMHKKSINSVRFIVCNTDNQALQNSPVPFKLRLGENMTEGTGAGADPNQGKNAANESIKKIKKIIDKDTKVLFVIAGMGGGTGTGASPVIAEIAKKQGILTIGIVTKPFDYEGPTRKENAKKGIDSLRNYVDSLIMIDNNKLSELYPNDSLEKGFEKPNEAMYNAANVISSVMTRHYYENIDLSDVKKILKSSNTAIFGIAKASGEDRASKAVSKAIEAPLFDNTNIRSAKGILLVMEYSKQNRLTIREREIITTHLQELTGGNTDIITGHGENEHLEKGIICVTVIIAGFPPKESHKKKNHRITLFHNEEQAITKIFSKNKQNASFVKPSGYKKIEPVMDFQLFNNNPSYKRLGITFQEEQ